MDGWRENAGWVVAAVEGLLLLAMLVWVAVIAGKLKKVREAQRKLVGDTGVDRLEDVVGDIHQRLTRLETVQREQDGRMSELGRRLSMMKGRIGVHRFKAFEDSGSDLSFSIAFVNDEQDGVVITGIYSREQTFLYAKPLDKGQSAYMLTPEEKTAISQAAHKA